MTDQELIEQYLANGGTITRIEQVLEPVQSKPTKLIPTESPRHYLPNGNRDYKYLGKTWNILPIDQTTLNYGD
jgi:hypothetical protein